MSAWGGDDRLRDYVDLRTVGAAVALLVIQAIVIGAFLALAQVVGR